MSAMVLQQLLKRRERVHLTGEQKAELLEQHEHRCALCDRQSSAFEWDHIERFSESLGEQLFQPLCPECHRAKTATETHSFDSDLLVSHFERGVWDAYVMSPRPRPLVYMLKEDALIH